MTSPCIIYPAPAGSPKAGRFKVFVNQQSVHAYDARIDDPDNCALAAFDLLAPVHVEIEVPEHVDFLTIRPKSANIKARKAGNRFSFDLAKPVKLCIEPDGKTDYPLFLFANPPEESAICGSSPDVMYFGPGIHDAGEMVLQSGQTVYVAGGAIVKGWFVAKDADNIRIAGRGMMDAHENNSTMIHMTHCSNVLIEGITIVDQPRMKWTTSFWCCENLVVRNIKILAGDSVSNDGIDIVSCSHVIVEDCFVKCYDDCIVIKALRTNRKEVEDVKILNCLLWNIQAFAINIGAELDTPFVRHIIVKNCDIIHPLHLETDTGEPWYYYSAVLGIINGDDALVSDVYFDDIRIEDPTAKLICLKIMKTQWNTTKAYGRIENIYFKDIKVIDGRFAPSEIISYGIGDHFAPTVAYQSDIRDITFENFSILGKVILNAQEGGFTVNPCCTNLRFIESMPAAGNALL